MVVDLLESSMLLTQLHFNLFPGALTPAPYGMLAVPAALPTAMISHKTILLNKKTNVSQILLHHVDQW